MKQLENRMNNVGGALFYREDGAHVVEVVTGNGEQRRVSNYLAVDGGPQAFLVTAAPGGVIPPHFHRVDQYQLLFGGGGARYKGRTLPADTLTIHYADAFSTYGPIEAGEDPLEFYTLRAFTDRFIAYMPQERAQLPATRRHRNIHRTIPTGHHAGPPSGEALFDAMDDGLAAWRTTLGPAEPVESPAPGGSGQYCYVIAGSVVSDGQEFGPRSLAWLRAESRLTGASAGSAGCDILFLQFPRNTISPAA
jgi:hypothetical protein